MQLVQSLVVAKIIGGHFTDILDEAASSGKRLRFIGDNLNFTQGVAQERSDRHKHMVHMFASAVLIQEHVFIHQPNVPQIPLQQLSMTDVLLSSDEYKMVRNDCKIVIAPIIAEHIPQLSFLLDYIPSKLQPDDKECHPTKVVPLPVLPYNEMQYQDDIKILDYYEELVSDLVKR